MNGLKMSLEPPVGGGQGRPPEIGGGGLGIGLLSLWKMLGEGNSNRYERIRRLRSLSDSQLKEEPESAEKDIVLSERDNKKDIQELKSKDISSLLNENIHRPRKNVTKVLENILGKMNDEDFLNILQYGSKPTSFRNERLPYYLAEKEIPKRAERLRSIKDIELSNKLKLFPAPLTLPQRAFLVKNPLDIGDIHFRTLGQKEPNVESWIRYHKLPKTLSPEGNENDLMAFELQGSGNLKGAQSEKAALFKFLQNIKGNRLLLPKPEKVGEIQGWNKNKPFPKWVDKLYGEDIPKWIGNKSYSTKEYDVYNPWEPITSNEEE